MVVGAGEASPAAAASGLDAMAAAVATVTENAGASPLGLAAHFGRFGPVAQARLRYTAAADALLPGLLGGAVAETLATEGGSLGLYDALRSLDILEGRAAWQPGFVAGWLGERAGSDPTLADLSRHVGALSGPPDVLPEQDAELLAQARTIASEGDPAAFAFLELARDPGCRRWRAGRRPACRTSRPCSSAARAARSIRQFPASSPRPDGPRRRRRGAGGGGPGGGGAGAGDRRGRGAPVAEDALLEQLQIRTLDAWEGELEDLRVQALHRPAGIGADQRHARAQRFAARGAVPCGLARGRGRRPPAQPRQPAPDRHPIRPDGPVRRAGAHDRDRPAVRRAERGALGAGRRRRGRPAPADGRAGAGDLDRHAEPGAAAFGADRRGRAGTDVGEPGDAAEAARGARLAAGSGGALPLCARRRLSVRGGAGRGHRRASPG